MAVWCATDQYFQIAQAVITAYPFSMACWFYAHDITATHALMWVGDKDVGNYFSALWARGSVAGDPVEAQSKNYGVGANQFARTSTAYSVNTWHHACGVWASTSSRTAYLDGGGKVTDTDAVGAMANHDRTALGANRDSSPDSYLSGFLAEAAIWNAALTDAEVAVLAVGYSPLFVRPESLVMYLPFVRDGNEGAVANYINAYDLVGGLTFPSANAPKVVFHPRVYRPLGVAM